VPRSVCVFFRPIAQICFLGRPISLHLSAYCYFQETIARQRSLLAWSKHLARLPLLESDCSEITRFICAGGCLHRKPPELKVRYSSPAIQLPLAASSNRVNLPKKTKGMLSTGPFRCLAIFSSVCARSSSVTSPFFLKRFGR
jgi:hypothetical protein